MTTTIYTLTQLRDFIDSHIEDNGDDLYAVVGEQVGPDLDFTADMRAGEVEIAGTVGYAAGTFADDFGGMKLAKSYGTLFGTMLIEDEHLSEEAIAATEREDDER